MVFLQYFGLGIVLIFLIVLLNNFLSKFKQKITHFYPLFGVLLVFTLGFGLRLGSNKDLVDFGFYLTDVSYIFTYVLFTAALVLGQIKYWKVGKSS